VRINTNVNAINAQRNLNSVGMSLSKSIERLSSGLRINRAADDAAGLSISEKLRGQSRGLNQAVRNAQDGISMIQTAEGGLNETHSILQRMRELAVQASNDTLTNTDRGAIASEMTALSNEIDRIAGNTEFNTKKLLNGSMSSTLTSTATAVTDLTVGEIGGSSGVVFSAINVSGAQSGTTFSFTSTNATSVTLSASIGGQNVSQTLVVGSMTTSASSTQTLNFSNLGVSVTISGYGGSGTATQIVNDLNNTGNDTIVTSTGSSAAAFQVGANAGQTISVAIDNSTTSANNGGNQFGNGGTYTTLAAAITAFSGASTTTNAQALIASLDDAISDVSSNRANLGAVQNRLEHTIENLSTSAENLAASESRIRDADMATEMVGFTRNNILQQAATSILAQANQLPQGVLSLLK
jgi:flagellin